MGDGNYPPGMTSDDLIHVGEGAPASEPCAVCGEASGDCAGWRLHACGQCERPVTGSYEIFCAPCAELNQQSADAMAARMYQIRAALDDAIAEVARIDERGFSGPLMMEQFGRLRRLGSILRAARFHIPWRASKC